jgi:ribosomal protein L32
MLILKLPCLFIVASFSSYFSRKVSKSRRDSRNATYFLQVCKKYYLQGRLSRQLFNKERAL